MIFVLFLICHINYLMSLVISFSIATFLRKLKIEKLTTNDLEGKNLFYPIKKIILTSDFCLLYSKNPYFCKNF